jgi:hypothetical protein
LSLGKCCFAISAHFTLHDERLLRRAAAHHADMGKLIEIAKAGRTELHSLFEQDRR